MFRKKIGTLFSVNCSESTFVPFGVYARHEIFFYKTFYFFTCLRMVRTGEIVCLCLALQMIAFSLPAVFFEKISPSDSKRLVTFGHYAGVRFWIL